MAIVPGQSSITEVTAKVDLYEITESGNKSKQGTIEITCKKINTKKYEAMTKDLGEGDYYFDSWVPVLKELVTEIKGVPNQPDGTPWTVENGLIEAMATEGWQILPIIRFVGSVNVSGDLKRKN